MGAALTTADALEGMLNKPLYVALRLPLDLSRIAELLPAHLEWAVRAEQRGELFASGPFAAPGAAPGTAGGMTILRAVSEDEARSILAVDPFVREGVFTVDVRRWILMEGSVTLNVRFSDQSVRVL
ncbi:YciI family protein [uncultured Paraburkholderia sp.]|uniref:YciI family protein n=1 Tax=uncultured Paraburkholderia sp. TaxID=1822466 RepID=UPI002599BB23|nr:YciI family protein [uncultured Paraburkholderia sp.]